MLGEMFVEDYLNKEMKKGDLLGICEFFKDLKVSTNRRFTYIVDSCLKSSISTEKEKMEEIKKSNEDLQLTLRIIARLEENDWQECKKALGMKS